MIVVVAGLPRGPVVVPAMVTAMARGRPVVPVWENEVGGLTFEIGSRPERSFVKWSPVGSPIDLAREAARMRWAGQFTPVPEVIDQGEDDSGSWLLTKGLPGDNAVSERWLADPVVAVRAIGMGLRAMHDALPVESCPFSWSVEERVADAYRRADLLDPARWHANHQHLRFEEALALIATPPPVEKLVVCHADACAPNTLLDDDDGNWTGHVDLGRLGVADRWADIAIATWSTEWNYGPGYENELLNAYGIESDAERTAYYRLLWDL